MQLVLDVWFAVGFVIATVVAGSWHDAHARDRYGNPDLGYVVTESINGGGRVSGPIRWTRLGPAGAVAGRFLDLLRRSCAETLRASTVDFWEAQENPARPAAGFVDRRWPRVRRERRPRSGFAPADRPV